MFRCVHVMCVHVILALGIDRDAYSMGLYYYEYSCTHDIGLGGWASIRRAKALSSTRGVDRTRVQAVDDLAAVGRVQVEVRAPELFERSVVHCPPRPAPPHIM